ncbi:MAG: phage integrase family protein [Gemmatimonadetes bacterium]|nr:phage integrase family protein [Gemmatimonadota bacterium]
MAKRKKSWSKNLEEAGVRIRIYERPTSSAVWYSIVAEGRKVRRSLETSDRQLAQERARAIAQGVARERISGADVHRGLTLGQVFAAYRRHHVPTLEPYRQSYARRYVEMFTAAWGPDLLVADVDQSRVDLYVSGRRSLQVLPPGLKPREDGKLRRGGREAKPPRDGTLHSDFVWLSSVFNWACGRKEGGRRLLAENPLRDVTWPKEQNVRRPVARHERFVETMKHVEAVDPVGRLACILELARWTGRRESAICGLRASDLLLSEGRVLEALAGAGMDEALAQYMPNGALRWRDEDDKMGLLFISPISRQARAALDAYLARNPRLGDVVLFPSPAKPDQAISRHLAAKWLIRAEELAGLPKLERGTFHPYRRLWASQRKSFPDRDVAHAAGWKDTRSMKLAYQAADPATVLRVVEHVG